MNDRIDRLLAAHDAAVAAKDDKDETTRAALMAVILTDFPFFSADDDLKKMAERLRARMAEPLPEKLNRAYCMAIGYHPVIATMVLRSALQKGASVTNATPGFGDYVKEYRPLLGLIGAL
jgi:hypothetical protein